MSNERETKQLLGGWRRPVPVLRRSDVAERGGRAAGGGRVRGEARGGQPDEQARRPQSSVTAHDVAGRRVAARPAPRPTAPARHRGCGALAPGRHPRTESHCAVPGSICEVPPSSCASATVLALVPSEHNLAFLVVTGLEGGTESRDAQDRAWGSGASVGQFLWRHPGASLHPRHQHQEEVAPARLRLLERGAGALQGGRARPPGMVDRTGPHQGGRCPDVAPGTETGEPGTAARPGHHQGGAQPLPRTADGHRSTCRVPVLVSSAARKLAVQSGASARRPRTDGFRTTRSGRPSTQLARRGNCDPGPQWRNEKRHEPLAFWMRRYELGERKVMGSGNIKQRGRIRLAWRVGCGRPLDSLLIRS